MKKTIKPQSAQSSDTENTESSGVVTFETLKTRSAADLRALAELLEENAKKIEGGDMAAMDYVLEKIPDWHELLMLRYACACEAKAEGCSMENLNKRQKR